MSVLHVERLCSTHSLITHALQKRLAEGRKAFEKKVKAISRSATVEEFETATDNLSLLLISDGLPEGVQPKDVVTKVRVAYLDFDTPCPGKSSIDSR